MRAFLILGGATLLLLAIGGMVLCIVSFEMLKEILTDGEPVVFDHGGSQTQIPGRLFGVLVLMVPIVCALGGVWLLRSGFSREDEDDT
jgi:hypothetical protein